MLNVFCGSGLGVPTFQLKNVNFALHLAKKHNKPHTQTKILKLLVYTVKKYKHTKMIVADKNNYWRCMCVQVGTNAQIDSKANMKGAEAVQMNKI